MHRLDIGTQRACKLKLRIINVGGELLFGENGRKKNIMERARKGRRQKIFHTTKTSCIGFSLTFDYSQKLANSLSKIVSFALVNGRR